jgi:uncharacterized protein (DUF1778 family)
MARPPKDPELLMDSTLIVKMTAEQKGIIKQAADSEKTDLSAWIRPILIDAAKRQLKRR